LHFRFAEVLAEGGPRDARSGRDPIHLFPRRQLKEPSLKGADQNVDLAVGESFKEVDRNRGERVNPV